MNKLTLDTDTHVYFYEQDYYVLSNFSSFQVEIWGHKFPTSEHAYHFAKFMHKYDSPRQIGDLIFQIGDLILDATSAHDAFKIANFYKAYRREDWDDVKVEIMKEVLLAKIAQHEYVHKKLMDTGDRILVENSWRDDVWGWGENRDGQNLLGNIWMQIRQELK